MKTNMPMRTKLLYGLLVLLLVGAVYLFFALFEHYEKNVDGGWSEQARRNPYLAAEQYLQKQGIETEVIYSLYDITARKDLDTLFVEDSRNVLTDKSVAEINQWLAAGGHLIVAASRSSFYDDPDPLLSAYDISVHNTDCDCSKYNQGPFDESLQQYIENIESQDGEPDLGDQLREYNRFVNEMGQATEGQEAESSREERVKTSWISRLSFEGVEDEVEVYFHPRWALHHPALDLEKVDTYEGLAPLYWSGSEQGVQFMQFYVGDGLLTVLADPGIWEADEIGDFDHAYLLSILGGSGNKLSFLVGSNMPSIFVLTWRYGQELIIAFGCWLFVWLLYRGRRFLPPITIDQTVRRSLAEHIQAVAHFLWQRKAGAELLGSLRTEIDHQARLNLQGYSAMQQSQRFDALAVLAQLDPDQVAQAMSATDIKEEEAFTTAVKSLQTIKANL